MVGFLWPVKPIYRALPAFRASRNGFPSTTGSEDALRVGHSDDFAEFRGASRRGQRQTRVRQYEGAADRGLPFSVPATPARSGVVSMALRNSRRERSSGSRSGLERRLTVDSSL